MLKLILMLVNIAHFLRADAEASPKMRKYVGYKESDHDCSEKPNFSSCNQPCRAIWCSTPYTKCFAKNCKSFCWRKPDGFPCGGGLGACKSQSCELEKDVTPPPDQDCSGKPDFTPCNQFCREGNCMFPYTKCFDNKCKTFCWNTPDGYPCGGGLGRCRNQSCNKEYGVEPLPGIDCSGKPDFSPCNQWCRGLHCVFPYTKCFDNKCKSYCYGQVDGSPCGGGRGKCKNQSCQPEYGVKPLPEDPCMLPRRVGICKAAVPSFYFDKSTSTCKPFIFGGCDGNANNFVSAAQCEEVCSSHLYGPAVPLII